MAGLLDRLKTALQDRYAINREVGSGGMATVYLAEDVRHRRQVAVKVLRPELAQTLGPDRFFREIEIAAQLQHPNILPLLDSGEAEGFLYYVMPYVEGPSLRERLANQGELPIHDAVKILSEIVDALAEAHTRGIVHRDIKPDNVLLSGRHALVTDFGVAKAVNEATGRQALTTAGVALGTPSYMAPEQASADPNLDHRVDIYAVGCVAYEMLTGRPPFTGNTSQAVLAAHMTEQPAPLRERRASISPQLEQIVLRCLEKHSADRWQSAEELLHQLEAAATPSGGVTPTDTAPVPATPSPARPRLTWPVAIGGVLVAAALFVLFRPDGSLPPVTFGQTRQITLADGLEMDPALSPDGRMVAYAGGTDAGMRILVRAVSGGSPILVSEGGSGAHRMPRWSPDGDRILFTTGASVYVVPALGGTPRPVVSGNGNAERRFGTWSPDGRQIAYVEREGTQVTRLRVTDLGGGDQRTLLEDFDLHTPAWSPDGRFIAVVSGNFQYLYGGGVLGNLGPSAILIVPVDGGEVVQITNREFLHSSPTWAPDGRAVFVVSTRDGGRDIYRIPVGRDGQASGPMERLTTGLHAGSIGLAPDGSALAYSVFTNTANIYAIRIPNGPPISVREAVPVTSGSQHIEGMHVSRDGQWLAFDSDRSGNVDIYKMRLPDGAPIQLTTHPSDDFIPGWSADGEEIAFHSWRHGHRDIYVMSSDGGNEVRVTEHPAQDYYPRWSPDGRTLCFWSTRSGDGEIVTVARDPDGTWGEPRRITASLSNDCKWSPDGSLIAFVRNGVHVIRPDGTEERDLTGRWTADGATWDPDGVEWAPDGRRLYAKAETPAGEDGFWAIPLDGGPPRRLVLFDDPDRPSGRNEFATDGERLYFTVDNRQADVWVMSVEGLTRD